ncbi:V-type ATPase subunit [Candidatus Bathyarchaeota archaeon]|nr:V-type ATPase subunit [Candidatus Bathyarchaeota archaeon]
MNLGINYVVLRTHARIADLLDKDQMTELAEAIDITDFLERLKETPYGEVEVEMDNKLALSLEKVFIQKFIERIESIVAITPTKMGEFLRAYFDLRFEVLNLKRILRGKFTESTEEQIRESLIPITPYLVESYDRLIEAESLEECVKLLEGTAYSGLIEKLDLCKEYDALWPLELALNYIYASTTLSLGKDLPRKNQLIVDSLAKFETDVENILIALKRRGKTVDLEEIFPVTYYVEHSDLKHIIESPSMAEAVEGLKEPYKSVMEPIKTGDIALVRAMVRKGKYETASRARASDEYGFNVILAFLVYSEIEKDNLVGLAWGEVQGLDSEELMKYIVIPWG